MRKMAVKSSVPPMKNMRVCRFVITHSSWREVAAFGQSKVGSDCDGGPIGKNAPHRIEDGCSDQGENHPGGNSTGGKDRRSGRIGHVVSRDSQLGRAKLDVFRG